MKIRDGLLLCKVGDSNVVMATGSGMHLQGLTTINETGAFIWSLLKSDADEDTLVQGVCDEFNVDAETAREDVRAFVQALDKVGFLV